MKSFSDEFSQLKFSEKRESLEAAKAQLLIQRTFAFSKTSTSRFNAYKTGRKKLRSISALDYSCKKNFRTGRKNSKICVVISICTNFKKACYLPCVSVRFSAP